MITRMNPKCRLYCGPNRSGKNRGVLHRRGLRVARTRRLQQSRGAQHPRDQVERDVVEHDRHDHLVRTRPRLQRTGDAGPQRTGDETGDQGDDHVDAPRQVEREGDPSGGGGRHQHLAAATDVEHADAERESDAETRRDQRCGEGERLGEGTDAARERGRAEVVDRALEQRDVGTGDGIPDRDERVAWAGEEVDRGRLWTSSSVKAIMMPPTMRASTTASTEMSALPCVIRRNVSCHFDGGRRCLPTGPARVR